jgi:hypothetical protein
MERKASRKRIERASQGRRLVLIRSDRDDVRTEEPPLRIVDSEPRLQGGFRLTDR